MKAEKTKALAVMNALALTVGSFVLAFALALTSGCAKQKDKEAQSDAGAGPQTQTPSPSPSPGGSSSASASASAPSATVPAAPFGLALEGRLSREAASRPTDTPKAEDIFAAIVKSGVPLDDQSQHLASPIGALYCLGGRSSQGLAMSACEYADEAKAASGKALSVKSFAQLQHRDVTINKKTTLTILQSPYDAKSQAAHDKALAAFKAL
jgi:hypothetical protein